MPPCDADPDENITGEILAPNLKKKCSKKVIIGRGCGILFFFVLFVRDVIGYPRISLSFAW
jgi:hypothetical protein